MGHEERHHSFVSNPIIETSVVSSGSLGKANIAWDRRSDDPVISSWYPCCFAARNPKAIGDLSPRSEVDLAH